MNVLITGGLGHIGSKLIRSLPQWYNIHVVDNLSTNRYCSLFKLNRDINFTEGDFLCVSNELLRSADVIIHLAAITNATTSFNNDDIERTNVNETKQFIEACKYYSDAKFIFPSSTSVYGVAKDEVEEDDPMVLNPQSPYAESKLEIEDYLKERDMNFTILRFGTIFGVSPGMRFHTAINKFCYEAGTNQPLTIWKENYKQKRPYLGLKDCVRAIEICVQNDITNKQTYNVLTGNYKLSSIVKYITELHPVKINWVNTPLLNQFSYNVNFEKFTKLGFIPKDSIKREIKKTIGLFL